MIHLQNRNIGFYYEECDSLNTYGYDMVYKELPLDRITSGNYVK